LFIDTSVNGTSSGSRFFCPATSPAAINHADDSAATLPTQILFRIIRRFSLCSSS
jgi:hypothetical protein